MKFTDRAFTFSLISFLFGVGFSALVSAPMGVAHLLLLLAAALLLFAVVSRDRMRLLLVAICFIAGAAGVLRYAFWSTAPNDPVIKSEVGRVVTLRGVLVDEPDVREKNTQLTLLIERMMLSGEERTAKGRVLLIVDRYPEYEYGDAIQVRGTLLYPKQFEGEDGRVFDYPQYLKAKGVAYQISHPSIVVLEHNKGNLFRAKLFTAKHQFLENLARTLPEPENALAGGILLGGKRSLGEEWTEYFRITGIVHIIVLSGYNMTIVAEWLGVLFLFLGFYGSLLVSGLGIIIFALATGAGATVVRAAIMALLVLLARLSGRTYTMGRALLFAGVLMVLHSPAILVFDPSFQLSFLAALGLVFLAPILKMRTTFFRRSPLLEEVVISTLATQILVLPLLLYQTGTLSLVALFANILVLPIIPLTMLLSFSVGLMGFLGNIFSFIPALLALMPLKWILAVGKYGAALPFAAVHVPPFPILVVFVTYGILAVAIYLFSRAKEDRDRPRPLW